MNWRLRSSDVDGVDIFYHRLGLQAYMSSGVIYRRESDQPLNVGSVGLGWRDILDGHDDRPMNSTVLVRLLPI